MMSNGEGGNIIVNTLAPDTTFMAVDSGTPKDANNLSRKGSFVPSSGEVTFSTPGFPNSAGQYPAVVQSSGFNGDAAAMTSFQNMDELGMDLDAKETSSVGGGSVWNESKTKAGKERKRLPLACISCRRKKIKCSGEKPSCAHCLRSRTPCVYKQAARKAVSSRVDYMATIDRRLKRMEDQLIKHVPREEVGAILASTGRSVTKPAVQSSSSSKHHGGPTKRGSYMAFGDAELDAWAANSQFDILAGKQNQVTYTATPSKATAHDDGWSALPSKEVQEHLTEVYFDYVYGQVYFLLHKPSFLRRLRTNMVPPVLILAVCAVSARFSKHPAVRSNPPYLAGEQWAREAERIILKHYDEPSLTHLTVCLLLGLHELGTCQGGRSWALCGMATRMAFAMQLHKEPGDNPTGAINGGSEMDEDFISFSDRELRRRAMWGCFMMDRFTSSGTQRPPSINEGDIYLQLPLNDKNIELDIPAITERLDGSIVGVETEEEKERARENTGVVAYLIRSVALFGRIVKYLNLGGKEKDTLPPWDDNSGFQDLHRQVRTFIDTLPESLQYSDENLAEHAAEKLACQFLFLHIASHHMLLFLHRFSFPSNPTFWNTSSEQPAPQEFLAKSAQIAIDSAESISQILAKTAEKHHTLAAPFMGYCAFTSSTVHIVRAFAPEKATRDLAKRYLSINLRFLGQMSRYWGFLGFITDLLRNQYNECSDAYQKGLPPGERKEQENLVQYGDWFQKYPRGVASLSSDDISHRAETARDATLTVRSDLQTADGFFRKQPPISTHPPLKRGAKSPPTPPAKRQREIPNKVEPSQQQSIMQIPQNRPTQNFQSPTEFSSDLLQNLRPHEIQRQLQNKARMTPQLQTQMVQGMPPQQAATFSPVVHPDQQNMSQSFLYSSYSQPFRNNNAPPPPTPQQLHTPASAMSPTGIPWGFEVQGMDFGNSMFENTSMESGLQWFPPFNMDLSVKFPNDGNQQQPQQGGRGGFA